MQNSSQGYHDYLEKEASAISTEDTYWWQKLDYQPFFYGKSVKPNV